jgi:hypothetical protein
MEANFKEDQEMAIFTGNFAEKIKRNVFQSIENEFSLKNNSKKSLFVVIDNINTFSSVFTLKRKRQDSHENKENNDNIQKKFKNQAKIPLNINYSKGSKKYIINKENFL